MTSGELRDRLTFYLPTATTDALRGQTVEYTVVLCTVWANWRGLSSRELLVAQAMDQVPQYRATIRYRSDITPQLRAERLGRGPVCRVIGVNDPAGTGEWLEVDLVEET